jgi:hypothetical protein
VGAETAIVAYTDSIATDVLRAAPVLDRDATRALVDRLFPDLEIEPIGDELLCHALNPAEDVAYAGSFPGLDLVCSWQLVADRPSRAAGRVLAGPARRSVVLHAMHGSVDWCSFGVWLDGRLVRSLSASPRSGIVEDAGDRLPFEAEYWRPEGAPLPVRPMALGERALYELLGLRCDCEADLDDVDPEIVPMLAYRVRGRAA